jgi:hypothetical protein
MGRSARVGELLGHARRLTAGSLRRTALGVIVVPLVLAIGLTTFASTAGDPAASRVLSAADLERDFGIHVERVAVTAAGGLVDLRFTVVDQDKAIALFHDAATVPALYVEQQGIVLRTKKMGHHLSLVTGGRYFILFSNAGGIVQSGTSVSVLINDVRLTAIAAQS